MALLRTLWRSTAFRLAAIAFLVYSANLRPITSADTFPTRYLPISILTEFDLDLDEFPFLLTSNAPLPGAEPSDLPYFLQRRRGHLVSTYPVMTAVLATPVYAVPVLLGLTGDPRAPATAGGLTRTEVVGTLLAKIAASLASALSVALVYLALRRLTTTAGALWISLVYAFATSTWSVSSQGLWQTTMSQTLLAGTFLCFLKAREGEARRWVTLAGVFLALSVMCRPPAVIFAVLCTLYVVRTHRTQLLAFLPIPAVLAALLLGYNLYWFGTLNGGYEGYSADHTLSPPVVAQALQGLLVSPNRGILVFSPVLLAGFAGIAVAMRRRSEPLLEYAGIATFLTICFYATMTLWHGSFSYSYRYLVDLLPALALGMAPVWGWLTAKGWRASVFGALAVFSLAIQVVGVVYYPCDWYRSTLRDPSAMARFFDWRDLEVVQCLKRGPIEPDGLRVLRGMLRHE